MKFKSKNPHYEYLRKKWLGYHQDITQNLIDSHLKKITLGSLGGLMLLTTPSLSLPAPHLLSTSPGDSLHVSGESSKNTLLAAELLDKLPKEMRNLSSDEEKIVTSLIQKDLGIVITPEMDNKKLNRSYGLIGGEQHLYRYPGDKLEFHARDAKDWAMYGSSGIAPGLGAWGYFAPSRAEFSNEDEERERYYLAVQTFLSPGFSERVKEYREFYKFRKMLVVNPNTGQAVVAVIADGGPAVYTGKHLGGSPEVMHELGLASGPRKGAVLYFFVVDPDDKIPLGPLKIVDEKV